MGALKDFFDAVKDIKAEVDSTEIFSSNQKKSLSKASMEGIMYFPVIVPDSMSIEDAGLIGKALERQMASFTLTVMTMNPYFPVNSADNFNVADHIKKIHQNMGVKYDSVDLVKGLNTFIEEAFTRLDMQYKIPEGVSENIAYCIYENVNHNGMNKLNQDLSFSIMDVTNPTVLNEVLTNPISTLSPVTEAKEGKNKGGSKGGNSGETTSSNDGNNTGTADSSKQYTPRPIHAHIDSPHIKNDINPTIKNYVKNDIIMPENKSAKMMNRPDPRQLKYLTDNDAKKANELVPTLLHMRVIPVNKKTGDEYYPIDFILGIKTTLHPVSSEEMILNLCRGIKNDNTMFNFIRWTTGEIKFFKDFLFGVNELKLDAINNSSSANKWWTALKRRRNLAQIKAALGRDRMLPNATIVVTKDIVETIKDQYGYDLSKPSLIHKLMDTYFLIAFVIVDPALQRVTFMFDGRQDAEIQTYATLSREQSTNDRQFKEMLNMLGRRI